MKQRKAFTLIELLVVVGNIGMLSSVVLVAVFSGRSRARDGRRKADVKQLQAAVELYANASNGVYPAAGPDGSASIVSVGTCTANTNFLNAITPTYLPILPQTPPGTNTAGKSCYEYTRKAGSVAYKIKVPLENSDDNDAINDGGTLNAAGDLWYEVFGGPGSKDLP